MLNKIKSNRKETMGLNPNNSGPKTCPGKNMKHYWQYKTKSGWAQKVHLIKSISSWAQNWQAGCPRLQTSQPTKSPICRASITSQCQASIIQLTIEIFKKWLKMYKINSMDKCIGICFPTVFQCTVIFQCKNFSRLQIGTLIFND